MSNPRWSKANLNSLCSRIGDGIHGTPQYVENSEYLFINGNNLKQGSILTSLETKRVSRTEFEKHFIKFDENTLFLSINGTLGSLAKYRGESVILGKSAAYIKCSKINIDFLYYYLQLECVQQQMWNVATGSTIKNLSLESIRNLQIPTPLDLEQQKIAAVLSALDAKIACNNRINAELEAMAKTLYDYWFVQFDFPDSNGKPYRTAGGKMVYNPTLKREIPEGWGDSSLWEIAKFFNGLAMQKFRSEDDDYLPVIKIREMNEGLSDSTEKASPNIAKDAIVEDGDVLFSWSATLDVKIWSQGKGALNQHIFKVTSDTYPKTFYYFELRNYLQHFKMMADMRKTTMGHITQEHLKQSRVCVPPIELLRSAHDKINPLFKKHLRNEKENVVLAKLRDWLLPLLMNGQVTVA